ncbi:MAG: phenylalanine--tRNA ligase subunit beta [Proteobacteria bacterium]|nr:phenylalanine--tRNA ligase subunit beta [Pseudomonadota bacterium]
MNVLESWLRSMANPALDAEALAHALTMAGLEVESSRPVAPPFAGVVAARVVSVERHPNADRLSVCVVEAGGAPLTVVCGAPNVRVGQCVPFAQVGAKLPSMEIRAAKVRGVESQGMLCSAQELGLSEDHSGLLELDASVSPGANVREVLALDDQLFDIKLTPNRADCLSVLGVAREVAALTGAPLVAPAIAPVPSRNDARLAVEIQAPDLCGRFSGRVIRGVNARAPTPDWMKARLERSGQRPITALVDISNYVMLELGRPSHIFDLDKVHGSLVVRWGRAGERVELLNGQTVEVDADVGVIADDAGIEALAGVMGGEATAVSDDTRNIFIEAAFWWPEAIAGRARRFNFSTDASHRFERGVDFATTVEHIEHITRLVLEICGGEPGPVEDTVKQLPLRTPVRMRVARAQRVIGVAIPADEMAAIFRRLGLPCVADGEAFVVTPPPYRFDLEIEEDLIEEVARLYGFERIPAVPPRMTASMSARPEATRDLHAVRDALAAREFFEMINFSFVEPQWESDFAGTDTPIRLLNPIASQLSVMRTTLIGSLVANVRANLARKVPRIRVFELGRVFLRDPAHADGPLEVAGLRQPMRVAAAAFGHAEDDQWGVQARAVDFFDLKADLEALYAPAIIRLEAAAHPALHPGRSARVLRDGHAVGWIGALHPRWLQKYDLSQPVVVFEVDAHSLTAVPVPTPAVPSKFPHVIRDIAVIVAETTPALALLDAVQAEKPAIVTQVGVFDLYHGKSLPEGRKSIAFRVVMQHTERTLTDAEADGARDAIIALLGRKFSATLRS